MIPVINKESCIVCGNCIEVCPPQAISLKYEKAHIEDDLCEECGFCVDECPIGAISFLFPIYSK